MAAPLDLTVPLMPQGAPTSTVIPQSVLDNDLQLSTMTLLEDITSIKHTSGKYAENQSRFRQSQTYVYPELVPLVGRPLDVDDRLAGQEVVGYVKHLFI